MELSDDTITINITLHASIENVWRAWTEAAHISGWFGSDPKGEVLKAHLNVRKGGFFEITFRDANDTEHTCSGKYLEVYELSQLKFTWSWKSEPGTESVVTLFLKPEGNFTRMLFQHAHVGTASRHNYLAGWKSTFAKLDRMLIDRIN